MCVGAASLVIVFVFVFFFVFVFVFVNVETYTGCNFGEPHPSASQKPRQKSCNCSTPRMSLPFYPIFHSHIGNSTQMIDILCYNHEIVDYCRCSYKQIKVINTHTPFLQLIAVIPV